ncbi:MAG: hypothetical protein V4436_00040 [Patescibacteria group bacterium]
MNKLHKRLIKENELYAAWHKLPYISLFHFFFLIGIGSYVVLYVQNVAFAQTQPAMVQAVAKGLDYGPWFSISKWSNCSHLMQRGSVFELQNAEGQSMLSECTEQVPQGPFDWHSSPVRFRLVKEPLPHRDTPMPQPQDPNGRL